MAKKDKKDSFARVARMRQDNSLAVAVPSADALVTSRRVGKSGAIHISELVPGVRVNYMRLDGETFVVSSRSEEEIRAIASSMPKASSSPFAMLSASLRGQPFELAVSRPRGASQGATGDTDISNVSDQEVSEKYDSRLTRRRR